jgi:hypothetical protein
LVILPIGCDRPLVEEVVRAQIEHLERSGGPRRTRVLSPLVARLRGRRSDCPRVPAFQPPSWVS